MDMSKDTTNFSAPHLEDDAYTAAPRPEDDSRIIVMKEEDFWVEEGGRWFSWRKLLKFMGPGFLMCIAYIDPGNLESDLQAGARTNYDLGWVLLWSTVMGFLVQLLACQLGVATGSHLAEHCRSLYPRVPRLILWIMIEMAIIGSDVQEVIGSALALYLLSAGRIPLYAGVILTAVVSFTLLLIERLGVRHLEGFFAALVSIMALSFGAMFFMADLPYGEVLAGVIVPRLASTETLVAVSIIGSVVMPHNIYLHSALVKSRHLAVKAVGAKRQAIAFFGIESALVLLVTLFINVAVLAVFAKGFYGTEEEIGLENGGEFLGRRFGWAMKMIWGIGLLAAGQSSTMTGTYTGQFVMSGFLEWRISPWQRITITRSIAIWPTLLVALLFKHSHAMDVMNQGLNVLQSVQLPFAIIPVLKLTSSPAVMGELVISEAMRITCWLIAVLILAFNLYLTYNTLLPALVGNDTAMLATCVGMALYVVFVAYLAVGPDLSAEKLGARGAEGAGAEGGGSGSGTGEDVDSAAEPLLQQHRESA